MTKRLLACIRKNESVCKYKRKYVSIIKNCLINSKRPVNLVVSGLRYVGKSVILEQVAEELNDNALLLNLSSVVFGEDEVPIIFYNELEDYILKSNKKYVLIDELSLSEGYDNYVSYLILELNKQGISFVVSGSSYSNLLKLSRRELGCRSRIVYVQPFTFSEWLDYKEYTHIGVCSSNPQDFAEDIEECKKIYKEYNSEISTWFKEYLETYSDFMAQSKGLQGYLGSLVEDTLISNSRGLSTKTDCFNVDDACALLRLLSFKEISTENLDVLRDDYSDYFGTLQKETRNLLLKLSNGVCIKRDKARVKNIKNIPLVLKRCFEFKLIYFYKRNQDAKDLEDYLNNKNFELTEFLHDYNVILANLPLFLYYLEDIVRGVEGVSVSDLLNRGRYGAFIETYIISKYAIAFMQNIVSGYNPISFGGYTKYAVEGHSKLRNTAREVDIFDEYNNQAIEISISNKDEEQVYFCNDKLDSCIKNCVKVIVTGNKNKNLEINSYSVIRVSYPLFILLLEFFDFGNIEIELDEM